MFVAKAVAVIAVLFAAGVATLYAEYKLQYSLYDMLKDKIVYVYGLFEAVKNKVLNLFGKKAAS